MKKMLKIMLLPCALVLGGPVFASEENLDGVLTRYHGQMGLFYLSPESGDLTVSWINPKNPAGARILKTCKPGKFCEVMGQCAPVAVPKAEGSSSECVITSASKVKLNTKIKP